MKTLFTTLDQLRLFASRFVGCEVEVIVVGKTITFAWSFETPQWIGISDSIPAERRMMREEFRVILRKEGTLIHEVYGRLNMLGLKYTDFVLID